MMGQQCAKLPSVQSRFQLRNGAAGREAAPTGIRLPVKTGGPMVKERDSVPAPDPIGDEDGEALDPFRPRRDFPEGQMAPWIVQSPYVRSGGRVRAAGQGVAM